MFAMDDFKYTDIDLIIYNKAIKSKRFNYIKKMYFVLKHIYKEDLNGEIWNALLIELKRVDCLQKRAKKERKKQQMINQIIQLSSSNSLFNDERQFLNNSSFNEVKKRLKKLQPKSKKKTYKQIKFKDLQKSVGFYQNSVL